MKKFNKILLVMLFVFAVFTTVSCSNDDEQPEVNHQELLQTAFDNYNASKNFTMEGSMAVTAYYNYNGSNHEDMFNPTFSYKEGNDRQLAYYDYEIAEQTFYSELVEGQYISYDNITNSDMELRVSSVYNYELIREKVVTFGIELSISDFTYSDGKYIGNTTTLSEKFQEYYNVQNLGVPISANVSFNKLNITIENGYFKIFEFEYSIILSDDDEVQESHYVGSQSFTFGNTTVERPAELDK